MGFSARVKIDYKRPRKDGTCAIFLQVIINRKKARLDIGINWPSSKFKDGECLRRSRKDEDVNEYNVIIGNARSKANAIHKQYLIRGIHLTLDVFLKEYTSNLNKHNFVDYFAQKSFERWNKGQISSETYEKEKGTLLRLKEFKPVIAFHEFNPDWSYDFDRFLKQKHHNSTNTRWNRHKHVITYLNIASKIDNISFSNPYQRFQNRLNEGKWGPLTLDQFKQLFEWYLSDEPKRSEKIVLRRFLFSCNCALRISDLQALDRSTFSNGEMSITPKKTERYSTQIKSVPLNDIARLLLDEELADNPSGVFDRYSDQYSNRVLKNISVKAKLPDVNLHHHVARYTFASLYDQAGGNHTSLMNYMGLRKRATLEKYVKTNKGVMAKDIARMNEFLK